MDDVLTPPPFFFLFFFFFFFFLALMIKNKKQVAYLQPMLGLATIKRANAGPNPRVGNTARVIAAWLRPRYLLGTISWVSSGYRTCVAPDMPIKTFAPIMVLTFLAVAAIHAPMKPNVWPPIIKYRRPTTSLILPTSKRPTPLMRVFTNVAR
jgi:hypothetical protein